jgi:PKD repeat protein
MKTKLTFILTTILINILCAQTPPYAGTIFIDPDIISSNDPVATPNTTYSGKGSVTMFDRRVNNWVNVNAYLFNVVWSDSITSRAQVNPEFGSVATATVEAQKYASLIGQLPACLRQDVNEIWIHKGIQPFGGGNNSILIHTGQSTLYEQDGILEETLFHEATHTSLDAAHGSATSWKNAQTADNNFISTYAHDNPTREDIAESFLTWLAVRVRQNRISETNYNTITQTIPNRLNYFDGINCNLYPLTLRPFPSGLKTCLQEDFRELEKIYDNTGGTDWTNKTNWFTSSSMGTWHGIILTADGCDIKNIYLNDNNLVGQLPMLTFLKLENINAWSNSLSGEIPNFNMPNLLGLGLQSQAASVGFSGNIPNFNMPKLEFLHLWGNKLTGSIPNFNMPNLKQMWLGINQLTGSIPNFNMPKLENLGLQNNQLSGTIPNFNMPNLKNLTLDFNTLTGSIPNFNLQNLEELLLTANKLSDSIPNFNLPKLKLMWLASNRLTGSIPNFDLPELEQIVLTNNLLTGEIPNFKTPALKKLFLSINKLTGIIPNFAYPNLDTLFLRNNQLTGSIPNFNLPKCANITLRNNKLTGPIPNFNLPKLKILRADTNMLSGVLPSFSNCAFLSNSDSQIRIDANKFVFGDIENRPWLDIVDLKYNPQSKISIQNENGNLVVNTGSRKAVQSYQWYRNDTLLMINMDSILVSPTPGMYYCKISHDILTIQLDPKKNLVLQTEDIEVVEPPLAQINFNPNPGNACDSIEISFEGSSIGGPVSTYLWEFIGGVPNTSNEKSPKIKYVNAGNFGATLIIANIQGSDTLTLNNIIKIDSKPIPGFSTIVDKSSVAFINSTTNAVSYLWNFGDGKKSADENPKHEYLLDGDYSVILQASNECGLDTFKQTVIIANLPLANFEVANTNGCSPFTINFKENSLSNITSWNWEFIGGVPITSTEKNPTVIYNKGGLYAVTLIVGNAVGYDTIQKSDLISISSAPIPSFNETVDSKTVSFNNTSKFANSYLWDFGDGNFSSETNPIHTFQVFGTFKVILHSFNECDTILIDKILSFTSATTEFEFGKIDLYPNPNNGDFILKIEGENIANTRLMVVNQFGVILDNYLIEPGKSKLLKHYQKPNYLPGIYFLNISNKDFNRFVKFVIH